MLFYVMLCYVVLCCVVLHCIALHCIALHYNHCNLGLFKIFAFSLDLNLKPIRKCLHPQRHFPQQPKR
jgi:hypothetical protein